jgi:cell wall-associated NlpC family hydrolase
MVTSGCPIGSRISDAIDSLLGTRFRIRGRDPKTGIDCVGLLLIVIREVYGIDLPDPARFVGDVRHKAAKFITYFDRVPLQELRCGDFLYFTTSFRASDQHIAIYEGKRWIAEADNLAGVRRRRIDLSEPSDLLYIGYRLKDA